jgi:hypothetical protein
MSLFGRPQTMNAYVLFVAHATIRLWQKTTSPLHTRVADVGVIIAGLAKGMRNISIMANSKINIQGLDKLRLKLAFMKDPRGVKAGVAEAANHLKAKASIYPPPPAGSSYVRTGTLGRKWIVNLKNLGATVSNNTTYGPFVQGGDGEQTMQHAMTGWQDTDEIAEEQSEKVVSLIQEKVDKILNR